MKLRRFGFCVAVLLLASRCGSSPTEPAPAERTGTLLVVASQAPPCSLSAVRVEFRRSDGLFVGGAISVPGETRFSAPVGRYRLTTYSVTPTGRAMEQFAGNTFPELDVAEGGTATLSFDGFVVCLGSF